MEGGWDCRWNEWTMGEEWWGGWDGEMDGMVGWWDMDG